MALSPHYSLASGLYLLAGAADNTVGGTVSGAGNIIAFNGTTGVVVGNSPSDTGTTGNSILGNSIFNNTDLGIDLGNDGVTANTPGGPHAGPNDLQNFPTIGSVVASGNGAQITFSLNSTPNHTFRIDVYADAGNQGRTLLGSFSNLATDAMGNGGGILQVATPLASLVGQNLTATATDLSTGDTSEFSFPAFAVSGR